MRLRKQKIELDFRITSEWCMHLMHMNERTECPLIKLIPLPTSIPCMCLSSRYGRDAIHHLVPYQPPYGTNSWAPLLQGYAMQDHVVSVTLILLLDQLLNIELQTADVANYRTTL
jgi:hypothetical protein